MKNIALCISCLIFSFSNSMAIALEKTNSNLNYANVIKAVAKQSANGNWCFDVTVRHNDTGWGHYANGWQVTDENGVELAYRSLAHPHVNEQPFTRSKCGIVIPKHINKVSVRAKCKTHGYGKAIMLNIYNNKVSFKN
jgi:hypothetical protein